jgi:hypothetical protein
MPKRTNEKPLGYEPYPDLARSQMYDLVQALNGVKPRVKQAGSLDKPRTVRLPPLRSQKHLRRLVQTWMNSGPNLIEMFKREPELELLVRYGKTRFYPTHGGRGHLDWIPEIANTAQSSYTKQAIQDFMFLIANPLWELLGGPCARCGDYYLKKAKRRTIYCSRNCSSEMTAIAAVKKRRQQEHADKVGRAQEAIEEWTKRKRRLGWKAWVSNLTGYTVRWITRAVSKGHLKPPLDRPQ